ncbi:MAG: hypothetical protein WBG30_13585 [Psychrilyobacter sp.]|uniref:hypothetical protein n=1 Tax=Psychrilyobacter sp. TaxID=2586924 RepID=UPI003C712D8A
MKGLHLFKLFVSVQLLGRSRVYFWMWVMAIIGSASAFVMMLADIDKTNLIGMKFL